MATPKISQSIKRAHELRKAAALLSYASWCEIHATAADSRAVVTPARRVLRRAERT